MRNIFGKYLPINSFVHFLDARLKLFLTVLIIVTTFLVKYLVSSLFLLLVIMIIYYIVVRRIRALLVLTYTPILVALFVFVINYLTQTASVPDAIAAVPGAEEQFVFAESLIFNSQLISITYDSILLAVSLIFRIYTIILVTSLLTLTTKQVFLTKAIEFWIYPLKIFFIPVEIISMIIAISLRFIPTLLEEAQRIMKAQASRGVDFKNGKLKDKAKALITLIVPLFVTSFNKAEDLAYAMTTRGYDPYKARTKYRKLTFKWYDFVAFLFFVAILIYVILTNYTYDLEISNSGSGFWHNFISYDYIDSGFFLKLQLAQ